MRIRCKAIALAWAVCLAGWAQAEIVKDYDDTFYDLKKPGYKWLVYKKVGDRTIGSLLPGRVCEDPACDEPVVFYWRRRLACEVTSPFETSNGWRGAEDIIDSEEPMPQELQPFETLTWSGETNWGHGATVADLGKWVQFEEQLGDGKFAHVWDKPGVYQVICACAAGHVHAVFRVIVGTPVKIVGAADSVEKLEPYEFEVELDPDCFGLEEPDMADDLLEAYDSDADRNAVKADAIFYPTWSDAVNDVQTNAYSAPCLPIEQEGGGWKWEVRAPTPTPGSDWHCLIKVRVWRRSQRDPVIDSLDHRRSDDEEGTYYEHLFGYQLPELDSVGDVDTPPGFTIADVGDHRLQPAGAALKNGGKKLTVTDAAKWGPVRLAKEDGEDTRWLHRKPPGTENSALFVSGTDRAWAVGGEVPQEGAFYEYIERDRDVYVPMVNNKLNMVMTWLAPWELFLFKDDYREANEGRLKKLDQVVAGAAARGVYLLLTMWPHDSLRGQGHDWGASSWDDNGFHKFKKRGVEGEPEITAKEFVEADPNGGDDWQKDLWDAQRQAHRLIVGRFKADKAIGIWQLVCEVQGTNAWEDNEDAADPWHGRTRDFVKGLDKKLGRPVNSSSNSATVWDPAEAKNDIIESHIYYYDKGPRVLGDAGEEFDTVVQQMHNWATAAGLNAQDGGKPAFIGEHGIKERDNGDPDQPWNEHGAWWPSCHHFAVWSALASGHPATPFKWNDGKEFGEMTAKPPDDHAHNWFRPNRYPFNTFAVHKSLHDIINDIPFGKTGGNDRFGPVAASVKTQGQQPQVDGDFLAYALKSDSWGVIVWVYKKAPVLAGAVNLDRDVHVTVPEANTTYEIKWYNTWEGTHVEGKDDEATSDGNKSLKFALIKPFQQASADSDKKYDGYDAFCKVTKKP